MEHLRTYRNAVVVISGGASGIGAALARTLVNRGAKVVVVDRDLELAEALAAKLGPSAESFELDVRDGAAFATTIEAVWSRHGRIDYLFNNAGIASVGEVIQHSVDDLNYVVDVNLRGVLHGIAAVYPRMVAQGFGHIVNMASISGLCALPGGAAYAATKHAIVGLSRSLRIEARRHGVRVGVLCPGPIRTGMLVGGGKFGRNVETACAEKSQAFWEALHPVDPDLLAERVLRRISRDHAIIVEPLRWRVAWMLDRLSPRLSDWYLGRRWSSGA